MRTRQQQHELNKLYKPNPVAYWFYATVATFNLLLRGNVKFDRTGLKEAKKRMKKNKHGFLFLYSHSADADHWINVKGLEHTPTNFVLAKYFLFKKAMSKVITWVKGIYKDQFVSDLGSIRNIRRAIERPGVVAIAPAGQETCDGGRQYVPKSIVKLVRFCKCDIVTSTTYGNHFYNPKWGGKENVRKVKTTITYNLVIKAEDIPNLSDEEIYNRIYEKVSIDEFAHQKEVKSIIKGKNQALGLDGLLYKCPKCHQKFHHSINDNIMKCDCGNEVKLNEYGFFEKVKDSDVIFENEYLWNKWQENELKDELLSGNFQERIVEVDLYSNNHAENKLDLVGHGKFHIGSNFMYYEGTEDEKIVHKDFAIDQIASIPHHVRSHFYAPDSERTYKFVPTDNVLVIREIVQIIDAKREIAIANGKDF